jgi:hypothetical protein
MKKLIKENKKDWIEMDQNTNATDYEIQRWLQKLDTVAAEYESRWGVSRLHKLVPFDMAQKWNAQQAKLNAAIQSGNLYDMPELVEGTIRGYAALEAAAIKQGHKPHDAPLAWTVGLPSGKTLAIVRHEKDFALFKDASREFGDVVCWTLDQIANIIENQYTLVNVVKPFAPKREAQPFDFTKGGDALPEEFS